MGSENTLSNLAHQFRRPYETALAFMRMMREDTKTNVARLDSQQLCALHRAYRFKAGDRPVQDHNYARRLEDIIMALQNWQGSSPRILDAGCGMGSESILFALLGAYATGVDVSKGSLEIAVKRADYYARITSKPFRVCWINGDVIKATRGQKFDIVWAREAISHIWPVEEFLDVVREVLELKGLFIVSDVHRYHPVWMILDATKRGLLRKRYTVTRDGTGEEVRQGWENTLSTLYLKRELKARGFHILKVRRSNFFADSIMPKWAFLYAKRLEGILAASPLRQLGLVYTLLAQKVA